MLSAIIRIALAVSLFGQLGCSGDSEKNHNMVRFEFIHTSRDEVMIVETSDEATVAKVRAELQRPMKERTLHISGIIAKGTAANSREWSWHFIPGQWSMTENSMELCDSWPSYIEENLETWIGEVGIFCPWASRVNKEL